MRCGIVPGLGDGPENRVRHGLRSERHVPRPNPQVQCPPPPPAPPPTGAGHVPRTSSSALGVTRKRVGCVRGALAPVTRPASTHTDDGQLRKTKAPTHTIFDVPITGHAELSERCERVRAGSTTVVEPVNATCTGTSSPCPICFDEDEEQMIMQCCERQYCINCLGQHARTRVQDRQLPVPCPGCRETVAVECIAKVLSSEDFERFIDFSLAALLEKEENAVFCPTPDCNYAFIREEQVGADPARSEHDCCPNCRKICLWCLQPAHPDRRCSEVKLHAQGSKDDELLEKWRQEQGAAQCPWCKAIVEKAHGCDFMSCRCGHHFCYRCQRPKQPTDPHYCQDCMKDNGETLHLHAARLPRHNEQENVQHVVQVQNYEPVPMCEQRRRFRHRQRPPVPDPIEIPTVPPAELRRRFFEGGNAREALGLPVANFGGPIAFAVPQQRNVTRGPDEEARLPWLRDVHERAVAACAERAGMLRNMFAPRPELAKKRQGQAELAQALNVQIQEKKEQERVQAQQERREAEVRRVRRDEVIAQETQRRREKEKKRQLWDDQEAQTIGLREERLKQMKELERRDAARIAHEIAVEVDRLRAERARERRLLPSQEEVQNVLQQQIKEKAEQRRQQELENEREDVEIQVALERERLEAERERERRYLPSEAEFRKVLEEQIAEKAARRQREELEEARLDLQIANHVAREAEMLRAEQEREYRAIHDSQKSTVGAEKVQWAGNISCMGAFLELPSESKLIMCPADDCRWD